MAETYVVVKQQETVGKLADGTWGTVVRVVFRTAGDVILSVDVPIELYSVDNVRAAIENRASHADAIQSL